MSATSVDVDHSQSTVTPVAKSSQTHSQHQLHTSDVDITQSVIQVDDQSCFQSFIQLGLHDDGIGNYASMPSPDDEDAEPDPVMNDLNDDSEMTSGQHRSLPEWLTELVAEKIEFLKQTDSQGCPTLYSKLGTFWLPHKCGWFNMLSSKKLKPELLYHPRFFYWDPMHLVEISCPHLRHVTSALMSIPRLRSMGLWCLKAILSSLSIAFPRVFLTSTHRYFVISVVKFTQN